MKFQRISIFNNLGLLNSYRQLQSKSKDFFEKICLMKDDFFISSKKVRKTSSDFLALFRLGDMWLLIRSIILIEFCLTFEYRHSHPKVLIVTTTRTSIWSRYYFVSGFLIKTPYFGGCWAVKFLIITFIFFYEKRSFSNQYVCTQWFGINY